MTPEGYYSFPAIYKENIVFVSEGDIWHCSLSNLMARRLTCNRGIIKTPVFSPDGNFLAFSSTMEGKEELYIMPSLGGEVTRITYLNSALNVISWQEDGIYFTSAFNQPFAISNMIYRISPSGGLPEKINIGPANYISFNNDSSLNNKKGTVIQRHGYREYGHWKRYRGGTVGEIWISDDNKNFNKLVTKNVNFARPIWLDNNQIVFSSDQSGIGNLYLTDYKGDKIQPLTQHKDFYVRNQYSDGNNIVYQAGGDIWFIDIFNKKASQKLAIKYYSDRQGRARKFFNTGKFLQGYDLHPNGKQIAIVSRGKVAWLHNWAGSPKQIDQQHDVRHRLPTWFADGKRILLVNDESGEDTLVICNSQTMEITAESDAKNIDLGRVLDLQINSKQDFVTVVNHRHDLLLVDLKTWAIEKIDSSAYHSPSVGEWSRDGKWFTYSISFARRQMIIKLFNLDSRKTYDITKPVLLDHSPIFDPNGQFIYFISNRIFNTNMDSIIFDYNFSDSAKIYAIPLSKDTVSPFLLNAEKDNNDSQDKKSDEDTANQEKYQEIKIDFDNIQDRLFEFPIKTGDFYNLQATKKQLLFMSSNTDSSDEEHDQEPEHRGHYKLESFDFKNLQSETLIDNISDFSLSNNLEYIITRVDKKLRVTKVAEKFNDEGGFNEKNGWINLSRIKFFVNPAHEWQQIYKEAWRLQRDHYWIEDMSKINWSLVFKKYYPLLNRVSIREEFSDLLYEMQGELGTSHAYVTGGENKKQCNWFVGNLGADFTWCDKYKSYKVSNIVKGDIWDTSASSSLINTGGNVQENDYIISINKQKLTKAIHPQLLLFNKANTTVEIETANYNYQNKRTFLTKLTTNLYKAKYREWVNANRTYINQKTDNKIGYIHIPDMSTNGFIEFYRNFLLDLDKPGLIIDVRFNGGGHISQLLLSVLARKRIGYDKTRWHGVTPYPEESPMGPMVALANEYTGSDGDIFSHAFKMMKLGKLIGKRTWGGVIGISPRYNLMDGGMTTQPEFSFYFNDVAWKIENYGVEPDIEVEITPQQYTNGIDNQLDTAIEEVLQQLEKQKIHEIDMTKRPDLSLPKED